MQDLDFNYIEKLTKKACEKFEVPNTENEENLKNLKFECIDIYIEVCKNFYAYKEEFEKIKDKKRTKKDTLFKYELIVFMLEGAKNLGEKFFANAFIRNHFKDTKEGYIYEQHKEHLLALSLIEKVDE